MLAVLAVVIGIYLGLHFTVLILVPGSLLIALIFAALHWLTWSSAVELPGLLLSLFALQSGYMLGLTGRDAYGHLLMRLNIVHSRRI
jgi:hypothetical protein